VHVGAAPPSYSILPPDPILLGLSGKLQLRFVQSLPAARPNSDVPGVVTWTTDNASVATVSGGLVTGVAAGTATIKACVATNCASTLASWEPRWISPERCRTSGTHRQRADFHLAHPSAREP